MNKLITFIALCIVASAASAQNKSIKAGYDERVELMSILCHLAGFQEYNMDMGGKYIAEIDSFFNDVKGHPAVVMMDSLHRAKGISYDSPMAFAIHLKKADDRFVLADDSIVPERRWKGVDLRKATATISDFYRDSNFSQFFASHKPFYEEITSLYNSKVLSLFNQNWYKDFYGMPPTDNFEVVIGFTNGGANYGPSRSLPGRPRDVYAVIGFAYDDDGVPYFSSKPEMYLSTLVHEFNHSFVNPLTADSRFSGPMKKGASEMLKYSKKVMNRNAYSSWQTLVNESIVRAAVILYLIDNGRSEDEIRKNIISELSAGFYGTPELVKVLRDYSADRKKYPSFDRYYPVLIDFFGDCARNRSAAIDSVFSTR